MSAAQATRIANVTLQIIRGMHQLYIDTSASAREQRALMQEFRRAVTAYLVLSLDG